jgi:potassium-transporting ATPase KdpC subunit
VIEVPGMFRDIVRSLLALAALTVICGIAFPLVVWGIGQVGFSGKANGSLVHSGDRAIGSSLIGQEWKGAEWFHGRQSAVGYDANGSGGSNLGPNSAALAASVKGVLAATAKEDGVSDSQVPVDLVTSAGSGLDPDISLPGALIQVKRVARARGLQTSQVEQIVRRSVEDPTLGFLGSRRVNVLRLNRALAELRSQ